MNEKNTPTAAADENRKKAKRTDNERLQDYCNQRAKLIEQQSAARKKSKEIDRRIFDYNAKIAELENKALFKICKEKKITTQELIDFLRKLPNGTSLENVGNSVFQNVPKNSDEQKL